MKVNLKSYLDARDEIRERQSTPGPVVTISRDFGCSATPIGEQLIERIAIESQAGTNQGWHLINKEILEDAANALHVNETRIKKLMESDDEGAISSLLSSLGSPYGTSDKKIIETLRDVIWHYAEEGKTVIIGRGGAFIAQKITKALHIKIQAPLAWRIKQIETSRKLNHEEATNLVREMDHKRESWIEHLINKPVDFAIYDVIFNRQSLTDDEIIDAIIELLRHKDLIESAALVNRH